MNFDHVTRFGCPIIEFVGAHDETTSASLTIRWFKHLKAPSKRLVIFADPAYMIMEEQHARFLVHLVEDALPLATRARDGASAEQQISG